MLLWLYVLCCTPFSPMFLSKHCLYSKLIWCFVGVLLSVKKNLSVMSALSVFLHIISKEYLKRYCYLQSRLL